MEKSFKFIISDKGVPIFQGSDFNNFIKTNKLKRGYMKVFLWSEKSPKSLGGYYKNVIIPELNKAYFDIDNDKQTENQTEYRVWEDLNLFELFDTDTPNIFRLEHHDAVLVVEKIKRHASINLNYYIE